MKTLNNHNSNSSLDIMTDNFWEYLKLFFPNMTDKVLSKNLWFYRLLNDYNWKSINWIYDFLSEKWYNSEWNKLLSHIEDILVKLTDKEKEEILKWNLLIWTKFFIYENAKWDDFIDMLYLVLASKKDNPIIKEAKSFFQDLLPRIFWVKNN